MGRTIRRTPRRSRPLARPLTTRNWFGGASVLVFESGYAAVTSGRKLFLYDLAAVDPILRILLFCGFERRSFSRRTCSAAKGAEPVPTPDCRKHAFVCCRAFRNVFEQFLGKIFGESSAPQFVGRRSYESQRQS